MNNNKHFIPLMIPDIRGKPEKRITKAIKDNWVSSVAPDIKNFEREIAKIAEAKYCMATITGSAALHLALKTLGIGKGSKVLVPDLTFAATINSVILSGAEPIIVDINNYSWTLSIELTEAAIKKFKPDAIVAVHTLGHPAEMDELKLICKKYEILLIEDAAGALGAEYKGKAVGCIGDAGIFSFNGNKLLTTGSGGALVFNKKFLIDKANILGRQAKKGLDYNYIDVGYNYRMSNLNALLGYAQIEYFNELINKKRKIADIYDNAFKNINQFGVMPRLEWANSSCWLYSLRMNDKKSALSLINYLKQRNIEGRLFWNSLTIQKPFESFQSILDGTSQTLNDKIVSIPCSSSLSVNAQNTVIQSILDWDSIR